MLERIVIKWCSQQKLLERPKTYMQISAIPFLNMYPTEGQTGVYQKTMTVFTATLFVMAPNWDYRMSVRVEEKNKLRRIDTRDYYKVMRMKG